MRKVTMPFFIIILTVAVVLASCNNEDKIQSEGSVDIKPMPSKIVESAPNTSESSEANDNTVKISKVHTNLEMENGWSIVPKGVHEMTITVEAENVDLVLFWIAPTGTETRLERELIGYDLDGSDGWSINWEFGNRIFHDHIGVQALGSDYATQANETLNIHSLEESNGQ